MSAATDEETLRIEQRAMPRNEPDFALATAMLWRVMTQAQIAMRCSVRQQTVTNWLDGRAPSRPGRHALIELACATLSDAQLAECRLTKAGTP